MKLLIEQCSAINISSLQKTIRRLINRDQPGSTSEDIFRMTEEELKKFSVNDQIFQYTYIKNQLGGFRWFFVCEKCLGRSQKLFLPPENFPNYEHKYLCRTCHGILNESVVKGNNTTYIKVIKPLKKLRKIEHKLEKGHISEKKVEELLNEYDSIEQEMKSSPEFRLYAFRKKRGLKLQ